MGSEGTKAITCGLRRVEDQGMESDWEAAIIRPTVHGSAGGDGREVWRDACDGVGLGRKWRDGKSTTTRILRTQAM